MTKQTKAKVPIKNPFTAKTAVLSGAKRSITDLYKPNRNPIAPMNKSTVLAIQDQSYKAGLLDGKRTKQGDKKRGKWDNPIGLDDALDILKTGAIGTATTIGVDLAAGQILPRLNITHTSNANVYHMAKIIGAVVAGELLNAPTKGMSYTGAAGAITVYMTEWAREALKPKLPASMPLGALPQMRIVQPPRLPDMTMAGANLAGYGSGGNVTLTPTPVVTQCGCNSTPKQLKGVGGGIGAKLLAGVTNEPRLFGGVKRRR